MKKIRGDKGIGVIIHGNITRKHPVYYLKAKMSCFSFYLFSFFHLQNQRTGERNKFCPGGRVGTSGGGGEVWEKGIGG
jgi:hypothetical protein